MTFNCFFNIFLILDNSCCALFSSLICAHKNKSDVQADTELEFRGWIDSLMHEIKRLIAEKEKCFALNQKTISSSSNGPKLTSLHVSDQSNFVTELDANPVSGNICFIYLNFSKVM